MTQVDKGRIVDALSDTWDSIVDLCAGLPAPAWLTPTECPGWSVQDQVAHMIGTESFLAGRPAPEVDVGQLDYIRNPIGRSNEAWVDQRRAWAPEAVLEEFSLITTERRRALKAMTQEDFDAPSRTPAGDDTYGRFMQIRVFDCWTHEQDIRVAVGQPGHEAGAAVEVALDEVTGALGYVIGKQAGAPAGSSVRLDLTGPAGRVVDVAVTDRARVVAGGLADPTATVTLPATTFMRLAAGRSDPNVAIAAGRVQFAGDVDLGRQVATHLAYTI